MHVNTTRSARQKRDLDPKKEYEKTKSKLDEKEKENYEDQNKKIAYAMIIPSNPSEENVKIKVMDYIESMFNILHIIFNELWHVSLLQYTIKS